MTYLSSTLSIQNNVKAFIAYYCTVNIIPGTDRDLGIIIDYLENSINI